MFVCVIPVSLSDEFELPRFPGVVGATPATNDECLAPIV
jgi:hypothetical protein